MGEFPGHFSTASLIELRVRVSNKIKSRVESRVPQLSYNSCQIILSVTNRSEEATERIPRLVKLTRLTMDTNIFQSLIPKKVNSFSREKYKIHCLQGHGRVKVIKLHKG